jgi:hypothetical protein
MVRWENTCLPKEFGGAGIINTRLLNEALLTKWVWRIYKAEKGNICSELIRKKYLEKHSLATCKTRGVGGLNFGRAYIKSNTISIGGCVLCE